MSRANAGICETPARPWLTASSILDITFFSMPAIQGILTAPLPATIVSCVFGAAIVLTFWLDAVKVLLFRSLPIARLCANWVTPRASFIIMPPHIDERRSNGEEFNEQAEDDEQDDVYRHFPVDPLLMECCREWAGFFRRGVHFQRPRFCTFGLCCMSRGRARSKIGTYLTQSRSKF